MIIIKSRFFLHFASTIELLNCIVPIAAGTRRIVYSYSECLALEKSGTVDSGSPDSNGNLFQTKNLGKVISVKENDPAYLHCPSSAPSFLVAWTRLSDDALLAVGEHTFTQDIRFQVSKPRKENNDWILIIRRALITDLGCYVCETNTEPSTVVPIFLKVTPAGYDESENKTSRTTHDNESLSAEAIGMFPKRSNGRLQTRIEGNVLILNCTIEREFGDEQTKRIVWTRNHNPLSVLNDGKYSTDYRVSDDGSLIIYTLRIKNISPEADGGNYACEDEQRSVRATQIVKLNYIGRSSAKKTTLPERITYLFLFLFTFLISFHLNLPLTIIHYR